MLLSTLGGQISEMKNYGSLARMLKEDSSRDLSNSQGLNGLSMPGRSLHIFLFAGVELVTEVQKKLKNGARRARMASVMTISEGLVGPKHETYYGLYHYFRGAARIPEPAPR